MNCGDIFDTLSVVVVSLTRICHSSVVAGDSIVVLLEDVMEGWSLARKAAASTSDQKPLASTSQSLSVGLILRDHYVATLELGTPTAIATLKGSSFSGIKLSPFDADIRSSLTDVKPPTLEAQTTGGLAIAEKGLKLLRGKSINRFSSFVSSGAEDWILNGDANTASKASTSDHTCASEADRYSVSVTHHCLFQRTGWLITPYVDPTSVEGDSAGF